MKKSLVLSLVLILCALCGAQTHSGDDDVLLQAVGSGQQPRTEAEGGEPELQSDIWAELRSLRDMVVEQRVELRHLTDRVTAAESLVEQLQMENTDMEARMTAAESLVEQLQMENTDMEARMTAAVILAEEMQMENDAQATELSVTQQKLSSLQERLTVSERRVEELEKQQEGQEAAMQELQNAERVRKMAFTASLLASGEGNIVHDVNRPLIYRNVITNIGKHYNPNTGYFTAPIRGVYYFRFTGHVAHAEQSMMMRLVKNGDLIVMAGDRYTTSTDLEDNASNGVVLQLEVGDVVSVHHVGSVWDDQYHRTTFSGFLLFQL